MKAGDEVSKPLPLRLSGPEPEEPVADPLLYGAEVGRDVAFAGPRCPRAIRAYFQHEHGIRDVLARR